MRMRELSMAGRMTLLASLVYIPVAAAACVAVEPRESREVVAPGPGNGPPPHAPAHGYRRQLQQDGVTLLLDPERDAYVVVGLEDVFFFEKRYFRLADDRWFASARPDGDWAVVPIGHVPVGLRDYKPAKAGRGKQAKPKHR